MTIYMEFDIKMKNEEFVKKKLEELLDEVKENLLEADFENIKEFINYREYGLAHETLSTQLYEYSIPITQGFYDSVSYLAGLMEIEPRFRACLKELIKK